MKKINMVLKGIFILILFDELKLLFNLGEPVIKIFSAINFFKKMKYLQKARLISHGKYIYRMIVKNENVIPYFPLFILSLFNTYFPCESSRIIY